MGMLEGSCSSLPNKLSIRSTTYVTCNMHGTEGSVDHVGANLLRQLYYLIDHSCFEVGLDFERSAHHTYDVGTLALHRVWVYCLMASDDPKDIKANVV